MKRWKTIYDKYIDKVDELSEKYPGKTFHSSYNLSKAFEDFFFKCGPAKLEVMDAELEAVHESIVKSPTALNAATFSIGIATALYVLLDDFLSTTLLITVLLAILIAFYRVYSYMSSRDIKLEYFRHQLIKYLKTMRQDEA